MISDAFDADGLRSRSDLSLDGVADAKQVKLAFAKISGFVDMRNARFDDGLDAYTVQIDGYLAMQQSIFGRPEGTDRERSSNEKPALGIAFAKISGAFDMSNAGFDGWLDAYLLQVGGYVSMHDGRFADTVNMGFAKFGNNLDLGGATLADLDLSGASIAADLQLWSAGRLVSWKTKCEKEGDWNLNLRNARIGNLTDTQQAWPTKGCVVLNGATFEHLGGHKGETESEMLKRGAKWWDKNWANLNPKFSPSPYAQLATAFAGLGDRDNANEIRYRERLHERELAWDERKWGTWLLLSLLDYVAGYGIGLHTFRVLYWVLGFSMAGAAILWWTVPRAGMQYKNRVGGLNKIRGMLWCFGASLNRLLPIITLEEFKGFFSDPDKAGLKLWQRFAFSILGLVGWMLGGLLILAVSGLTQNQ